MPPREHLLHRTYLRMARRGNSLLLRIRPAGWTAGMLCVLLLFLGADPTRSLAYQLFSLMFCLTAVAVGSTLLFRTKAAARRQVAATGVPGCPLRLEIEITNRGRRPWRQVRLLEVPPPPAPDLEEFLQTPEPGEHRRNPFDRFFIFYRFSWLGERRQTFHATASEPFDLAPGATTRVALSLMPLRRGILELRDLRLSREDVFGFFRRFQVVDAPPVRLSIVPRPATLLAPPSGGSASRRSPEGEVPWHRAGQSDEFLSLRDYRPGDPIQHIHWAAFARAGRPIVREFEDVHRPRVALILDTLLPREGKAFEWTRAFEEAVEAAAALAGLVRQGDTLLELLLVQDRAHAFTSGPGHLQTRRLLEILAAVQPATTGSLDRLERLALAHAPRCGAIHFVGVQWDDTRTRLLTRLRARGPAVHALVVSPFPDPPENVPSWVEIRQTGSMVRHRTPPGASHPDAREPSTDEAAPAA